MGKRRKAREIALQFLYQLDLHGAEDAEAHEGEFWERHQVADPTRAFAQGLVRGTKQNQPKIDGLLTQYTEHWDLDRMSVVDRNVLRLALYELLWHPEVPPKVVINEAIELAKKFGTQESGRFVNGILDRLHRELRPAP
jgi:N utilization substance protein B